MTLATMRAEIRNTGGTPIPGYSWPVEAFPHESLIARTYPDNIVSCLMGAGRNNIQTSPVLIDADSADLSRKWTAQSANITKEADTGVLGGYPRYSNAGSGVAGTNSLQATLGAPLSSYTFGVLFKLRDLTVQNGLISVGPSISDRVFLFVQPTGVIAIQHTSSETKQSAFVVTLDTWISVVSSYDAADNTVQLFVNSTTADVDSTFVADPGTGRQASLLASVSNTQEANGEIAVSVIWDRALHTDAAAVKDVMTGLTGLASL